MSRSFYAMLSERVHGAPSVSTRRSFLAASAAAGLGAMLSCASRRPGAPAAPKKRIVIVGAGFAGLMAAHELKSVGYSVVLVDARRRVGGRVVTYTDLVPGFGVDGGGELIGANHPNWAACAKHFKLTLDPLPADEDAPLYLNGAPVPAESLVSLNAELTAALSELAEMSAQIDADRPWLSPNAAALDARSLQDFLNDRIAKGMSAVAISAFRVTLEGLNGVELSRSSLLAMLAAIKGGGGMQYWTESESFRCRGGAMGLAVALAKAVGTDRIVLGNPVAGIKDRGDKMVLTLADGKTIEGDDVILTVPPNVWHKIKFEGLSLPASLAPQMGRNTKYLAVFGKKTWPGSSPALSSDGDITNLWDAAPGAPTPCLAIFSGPTASDRIRALPPEKTDAAEIDAIERVYPGSKAAFVKGRFMNWPSDPWAMGAYSFAAPGQITSQGPSLLKAIGGLHLAGEHTSYAFPGYMEGALASGVDVARRIAARDGLAR